MNRKLFGNIRWFSLLGLSSSGGSNLNYWGGCNRFRSWRCNDWSGNRSRLSYWCWLLSHGLHFGNRSLNSKIMG